MPDTSTPQTRQTSRLWPPTGWTLLGVGLAALVLALAIFSVVAIFGRCDGEEFSPERFSRRQFYFYRVPLLRLQLTAPERKDQTNTLERYLQSHGFLPKDSQTTWHIVEFRVSGGQTWTGDPHLLTAYLDLKDDKSNFVWLEWTENNPEMAQFLWPLVAELARDNEYALIPEVMSRASGIYDTDEFRETVRKILIDRYLMIGRREESLNNRSRASAFYQRILKLDPDHDEAREAQARLESGGAATP
ncbi:MAG: hypothetical protein KDA60_15760 [Planctomycetales bacterium]|nr:hypothetical protein [Planctomycetales bacterium]